MQPNYRRCVSCRKVAHRDQFLRVVRTSPTRSIELEHGMGRSAYLCPQLACFEAAYKKNRLGRALRAPIPDSIYQRLRRHISGLSK